MIKEELLTFPMIPFLLHRCRYSMMCDSSDSIHSSIILSKFAKTGFCTGHFHLQFTWSWSGRAYGITTWAQASCLWRHRCSRLHACPGGSKQKPEENQGTQICRWFDPALVQTGAVYYRAPEHHCLTSCNGTSHFEKVPYDWRHSAGTGAHG